MNKGYLRIEGESVDTTAGDEDASGNKAQEDILDASGNKIDRKEMDSSTDKEKKKKIKDLEKKLKDGVKKKTLTDEDDDWEEAPRYEENYESICFEKSLIA